MWFWKGLSAAVALWLILKPAGIPNDSGLRQHLRINHVVGASVAHEPSSDTAFVLLVSGVAQDIETFGLAFVEDMLASGTAAKIVMDGSTGVMPLATALAEAFREREPGITIEMGQGLGTGARIQALAEGRIDIALASHGLKLDEITRQGMAAHEIARTAVVFAVNASVPVDNLTEQEICDIYAGKTSSWKTLGGGEREIASRTRPDSEVDAEVVRANIPCLKDLQMPAAVKVMPKTGDMAKELAETPGAIGMTSMTVVEQSQGKIRALSINGVAPSPENVERAVYPLVRKSFFVTRATPPPPVAKFLQFVRDPAGQGVIRANGAVPVR